MIYGLIIVKNTKKSLVLDHGFSNATFEPPNHVFALDKFESNPMNINDLLTHFIQCFLT
jgi:hypothetical protein